MLTDDETTQLQFAIDADDLAEVQRLIASQPAQELTELQLYSNSTVFMYACERSTPEVARAFLAKGVQPFELPYSDNNELKSAVRNRAHGPAMVTLVLETLPDDLAMEMITSDWNPDDEVEEPIFSAFQLAEKLKDPACKELLLAALERLRRS